MIIEVGAELIRPDWPAPANVHGLATTRSGGCSAGAWAGLNLGAHTGDDRDAVERNRAVLREQAALPAAPHWLNQVHGNAVVTLPTASLTPTADASCSAIADTVCAVLTADCLPVLFCNRAGSWVAAAHAGWRGLCDGVLEQTVAAYPGKSAELLAWFGPAIGPSAFEVGPEVCAAFVAHDGAAAAAFQVGHGDRFYANLYLLARQRLQAAGVTAIYGGGLCTFTEPARFYSYRRDKQTGRQATLIWRSVA